MKRIFSLAAGTAFIVGMTMVTVNLRAANKIRICHVEGQNSGRAHVIEISDNAVPAHLGHGDSLEGATGLDPGADCTVTPLGGN
jgi:hypothetical protein